MVLPYVKALASSLGFFLFPLLFLFVSVFLFPFAFLFVSPSVSPFVFAPLYLPLWSTSDSTPLVVAKDVFSRTVLDMSW